MRSFCLACLALLLFCARAPAEPELRNGIAAIVNEAIITFQEVETFTANAVDLLRRTYFNQPDVLQQKRIETLTDGLEQLLERQLILADFKEQGGALPDRIIDDEIKDRIRQRFGDRVRLTKTLQAEGVTYEAFRQRTRDEIIVNYMRSRNIAAAVLISPAKIERFYTTNLTLFKMGDQVKLRMIVLNCPAPALPEEVRKLAQEIHTKIGQGASFAEMASIYSEGSQRKEGGDWGWVDSSILNKGLSEVAFALQPRQVSQVIGLAREGSDAYWIYRYAEDGKLALARKYTSKDVFVEEKKFDPPASPPVELKAPQEFYIMLVEDRRAARTRTLEEMRDEIEKNLIAQERARLQKKWIDRLKAKAFVRYY